MLLSPIKDHHSERRLFVRRVVVSTVTAVLLLGIVIARLVHLQVVEHELFAEKAQGNRVRIEPVAPIRGLIFDRKGRVIAENLPAYQLELVPEQVDDIDDTLERLARLSLISGEDIPRFKELSRSGPRFRPVTLKFRLTEEEIANFAIQRPRFPGVDFKPRLVRHYPDGPAVAHAVGYVGALSSDDLRRLDAARYAGTSHTGKTGVEGSFESDLHGAAGYRHLVTNARGRQIPGDSSQLLDSLPIDEKPAPGSNVYLSIDLDLQLLATRLFEGRRGAVVALDPDSGEILALVSAPSFDPNLFAIGMSTAQYGELANNVDVPLFNRAVRGRYPPGSTIKPMLALAALETGATNLTRKTFCMGYFMLPDSTHRYRDWKPEGHGPVDLHDAIEQSCDVYFYEISQEIGIDNMHDYLVRFGLGKKTGVDIGGEQAGVVPSREWKRNNFSNRDDQRWYHGETVIASIGQGFMLATPLQLAAAAGALATRGKHFRPHMVAAVEDALSGERTLVVPERLPDVEISNSFYWDNIINAMHDVMQGPRGTARAVGTGAPYKMAGKSGTAQVVSIAQDEEYDEEEIEERQRDHALFISFAPLDKPRIAVAVIVENGSSGSRVAAPVAKAIMDRYLGYGDDAVR
ncbi:MAG: penicillin-binding protein 2 [Gammaproteobacteria bacterium]|nr:penicillin-binding protein 2 [Gammaproteobacteria bacterium]MBT8109194.1 penicillin-binding protein 2 [Gammaproteobacteria bacterium]NND48240.1 penicillin-binding protein 2 [Woeseiaceae bacterium]NNL43897.1 penicillin-binding protein 2 [Woeseiaceae bacterium]